jgi:hypothetical protein
LAPEGQKDALNAEKMELVKELEKLGSNRWKNFR